MAAKKFNSARSAIVAVCMMSVAGAAGAIEPIPEKTGWSGHVMFGGGFTDVKSNTVVGNDIIDVGQDTITSILQSPQSDDTVHPLLGLELKYTLANRSQFFFGSSIEDQLTMDFATQIGWRKQTDAMGTYQLSLLTSLPAIEVWEDPYLVGAPRNEVDRDSDGFRFEWDGVLGSGLGILLQTRDIDLDSEQSGTDPALSCDAACQQLLDRNGDQLTASVWYRFMLSRNNILEPKFIIRDEDRDGDAIAGDSWALQLNYTHLQEKWMFIGSVLFGEQEHDEPNPLYGARMDADVFGVQGTLLYQLPTQSGRWQFIGTAFVGESDSDITFHDNELTQIGLGVMYNFGG